MNDKVWVEIIIRGLQLKHNFKVTSDKIIINEEDLPAFLRDARTVCVFDYENKYIYFSGKKVITYKTEDEYNWAVIL